MNRSRYETTLAIDKIGFVGGVRPPTKPETVKQIADDMKINGQLTRIVVYQISLTEYVLIAGAHRLAAHLLLGLAEIDCIVLPCSEDDVEEIALAENVCRNHMSQPALDEAKIKLAELQLARRERAKAEAISVQPAPKLLPTRTRPKEAVPGAQRGRPSNPLSARAVAKEAGLSVDKVKRQRRKEKAATADPVKPPAHRKRSAVVSPAPVEDVPDLDASDELNMQFGRAEMELRDWCGRHANLPNAKHVWDAWTGAYEP